MILNLLKRGDSVNDLMGENVRHKYSEMQLQQTVKATLPRKPGIRTNDTNLLQPLDRAGHTRTMYKNNETLQSTPYG